MIEQSRWGQLERILGFRYLMSGHWHNEQEHQRLETGRQSGGAASAVHWDKLPWKQQQAVGAAGRLVQIGEISPPPLVLSLHSLPPSCEPSTPS